MRRFTSRKPQAWRAAPAALLVTVALAGTSGCAAHQRAGGSATYGDPFAASGATSTTNASGDGTAANQGRQRAGGPATTPARGATTTSTLPGSAMPSDGGANPATRPATGTGTEDSTALGPPGAYARALLQPKGSSRVTVEIIRDGDASPRPSAVAHLRDVLAAETGKPVAFVTTDGGGEGAGRTRWDEAALVAFADSAAKVRRSTDTAVLRFLVVHGSFGADENALGVAVRGDVFALFVDGIDASGSALVPATTIEEAVAVHEAGHLLGLVDLVLARGRDDPDHPHHSRNRGSVMYWAIDTDLVGQILGGPPSRDFDADDRADLAAIRTGA